MNKKTVICLLAAAVLPFGGANAAILDSAKLVSSNGCEIEISGDLGGAENNRFVTFFVTDDSAKNAPIYVGAEELSYDGKYSHKISLEVENGGFDVTAVMGEKSETKHISYASGEWLKDNVYQKIEDGTLSDAEILNSLLSYDIAMGLDFSDIQTDRDKNLLLKRVKESNQNFETEKQTVAQNVKTEIKFLNDLKSASHWSVAEKLVKDTLAVSGIDLSKYNLATNKEDVMGGLIGVDFANFEEVENAINNSSVTSSGSGGGYSGGTGGGGGGGSSSGGSGFSWSGDAADGVLAQNPPKQYGFVDLDSAEWAKEAINALYAKGIVSGLDETTFAPDEKVTREQFAKLAVLTFGFETEGQKADFADVETSRWSYPYIACGYNLGIIKGTGEGHFSPEAYITREDMAVILKRCAELKSIDFDEQKTDFSDWESISDYAKEAVGALAGAGYINGTGNGAFEPKAAATRAEAAKILYELLKGAEK